MAEAATLPAGAAPTPEAAAWLAEIDAALAASRRPRRPRLRPRRQHHGRARRRPGGAAPRTSPGANAVVVLFAWPTAENFLRYPRDIDNAFGAAPHLADLSRCSPATPRAARIDVFTYSAGATVGSDALALLARERPEAAARLGEVYHAAPDADFRGFVDDLGAYGRHGAPGDDGGQPRRQRAAPGAAVNRASRAGRPDLRELDAGGGATGCSRPPTTASSRSAGASRDDAGPVGDARTPSGTTTPGSATTCCWRCSSTCAPAERGLEPGTPPSGAPLLDLPARLSGADARAARGAAVAAAGAAARSRWSANDQRPGSSPAVSRRISSPRSARGRRRRSRGRSPPGR